MGKTTRKKTKASAWDVFELDAPNGTRRGGPLASFETRAEAEAFVRGLNFHDPKTSYAVVQAKST